MKVKPIRTPIFKEGENLEAFVQQHAPGLREKSILVITSKILALAEKRTEPFLNQEHKDHIVASESEVAIRANGLLLTVRNGMLMANAGIDESNADGKLILLPKDCFSAAEKIRRALKGFYNLTDIGVLITDSRVLPLRLGIVGVAMGYAGFKGIKDYRGKLDIFGREMRTSRVNLADSLAAAAVLTMGEGNEQCPLAIMEDAPVTFQNKIDPLRTPRGPKRRSILTLLPESYINDPAAVHRPRV